MGPEDKDAAEPQKQPGTGPQHCSGLRESFLSPFITVKHTGFFIIPIRMMMMMMAMTTTTTKGRNSSH